MSVRAKFKVQSVTRTNSYRYDGQKNVAAEVQTIRLQPVMSNDLQNENSAFFASTPSGSIELGVVNAEAGKYFDLDAEYYVEFTLATPKA